ncbi:MAG: hypothetical protein RIS76_3328 [Verrucomicrobiota bacterium]|jgi:hypothetical protein
MSASPPVERLPLTDRLNRSPRLSAVWCIVAAFGTYACMYGLRKPFTAAGYEAPPFGPGYKAFLVMSQVLGYTVSKWMGIRIIAEMKPHRRAGTLLGLVGAAEVSLVLFGCVPTPYNGALLFLNGLTLGLVFGLVLGFLEGRRMTEALVAALCASFILADGVTKSAGAALLRAGVEERWMPAVCGVLFLAPLTIFVAMLRKIPSPSPADIAARSERPPLNQSERRAFLIRYAPGLGLIFLAYLLITVMRSLRADFAPELWSGLGTRGQPSVFTTSEIWVALGVLVVNGLASTVRDNRRAFFLAMAISCVGLLMVGGAIAATRTGRIGAFPFMVLFGLGLYLPYVAVHTTIFERLIALTRDRGNVGHLMYVADSVGYLGYLAVMFAKWRWTVDAEFLPQFLVFGGAGALVSLLALLLAALFFARVNRPAAPGLRVAPVGSV